MNHYIVHKFGGSSLKNAESFLNINNIIQEKNSVIVVSATKGTTSLLQSLLDRAKENHSYFEILNTIQENHLAICNLILKDKKHFVINNILEDFEIIKNILETVKQISFYSNEIQDYVIGFGEIWTAKILNAYLSQFHKCEFLDASKIIFTYYKNEIQCIDWELSKIKLNEFLKEKSFDRLVVTGFIAADIHGKRTNLGRNGSDYSASVFSNLLNAKQLYIWKDVDGIYNANPEKVKSAFPIAKVSYKEALELAYFGAKVIHPKTIAPALLKNIPIYIKNTLNPKGEGTFISNDSENSNYLIKGVTSIEDVSLINIEGAGMIGVSGIASRIFDIIQRENISVILISQASSEYSICFAVSSLNSDKALKALNVNLEFELSRKQIEKISVNNHCAILAIVGDQMVGTLGIASKLFSTLANANINITAIAQGSSERNISVVIDKKEVNKALKVVHSGFYLSHKTVSIGLIGCGLVGSALINQLNQNCKKLKEKYNVHFVIRGIMNSKKMLLSHDDIDLENWNHLIKENAIQANMSEFIKHMIDDDVTHSVVIDCTANNLIANEYLNMMEKGIHIITPNKHANSGDFDYYKNLKKLALRKNSQYFYEATVCAGLPVINTLQDLIKTGDEVYSIEGIVSGTLSYIFNEMSKGKLFSECVLEAKNLGYTEPDPREDLSGNDVARKLICLGREIGLNLSFDDITVNSLVPEHLRSCSLNEFMERISECDKIMGKFVDSANQKNEKICYVGSINKDGYVTVNLNSYGNNHPFNRLQGTDNMIIIYTKRYHKHPLVIQGPGAGAEVTAAGIFADILRLTSSLN